MNQAIEAKDLSVKVAPIVQMAEAIQIRNDAEYNQAAVVLTHVKAMEKEVEDERVKTSKPLNEAVRANNEHFKRWSIPLETSERTVKAKMSAWYSEQQRIREEIERKAKEEARRLEEAERERLKKQAAVAEAKGRTERAEELKQQAAEVYIAPAYEPFNAETTVASSSGSVTMRQDIEVEVVNPYAFIEAILKEDLPLAWIKFDIQAIKRSARAQSLRPGSEKIPGVRIKPAIISAVRTMASNHKLN